MKSGWEVDNWSEAYRVVLGDDHQDNGRLCQDVDAILQGYDGLRDYCLEIGAGYGRLVKEFAGYFRNAVGFDSSAALVEMSHEYLRGTRNGHVFQNDGILLPAEAERYDFVYSYIAFQHMHTIDVITSYISEIYRVLKPGGICRIQTVKGKSNPYMGEGGLHRCHLFENENDFGQLFCDAGFDTKLMVGNTHFQHIWVTGRKPA